MMGNRILVDVNTAQIENQRNDIELLISDINKFRYMALKFRTDIPSDIYNVMDAVDSELVESFGSTMPIKASRVAYLLEKDIEYNAMQKAWKSIENHPVMVKYSEYIIQGKDGLYFASDELGEIIHEESCSYLEGKDQIKLYELIMNFFNKFDVIEKAVGRGGDKSMGYRTKLSAVSDLFKITNGFELKPDYNEIKALYKE